MLPSQEPRTNGSCWDLPSSLGVAWLGLAWGPELKRASLGSHRRFCFLSPCSQRARRHGSKPLASKIPSHFWNLWRPGKRNQFIGTCSSAAVALSRLGSPNGYPRVIIQTPTLSIPWCFDGINRASYSVHDHISQGTQTRCLVTMRSGLLCPDLFITHPRSLIDSWCMLINGWWGVSIYSLSLERIQISGQQTD